MNLEMVIVIIAIICMLVGLFFEIARPDLLVFFTLFFFIVTDIATTEEALVGFSNEGMLTIGLLFIVARVFEHSGLVERLVTKLLKKAESRKGAMFRLLLPISGFSGFLNNTPIVVTLTPIVRKWASEHNISPSKFLIPLSYASILGGTITLMGTSTNLVVHGLLLDFGENGFSFFELAWVGVPITLLGLVYLILIGHHMLPDYKSLIEKVRENTKDYLSEMVVIEGFPYNGETIEQAQLRNLKGLYLIEIIRGNQRISPVTSETKVYIGDRLIFSGMISTIADLQKRKGLKLDTGTDLTLDDISNGNNQLVEVVVSHQSSLLGKSIKESRFRKKYDAGVLAVHRNDEKVEGKIGDIIPKSGDLMLLIAGPELEKNLADNNDFYLTSPIANEKFQENENKGWFSLILLVSMISMVTLGFLSIFKAMVITVGILIATKIISTGEAKAAVQFQVLLLIASALGIGNVIIQTGTANWLANEVVSLLLPFGLLVILATIYVMTNLFTELITNNAAAVIMFPIGYEIAISTGVEPAGIAVLVAIAASASFLSPIGYQTNLIVYGPGGYSFKDYIKAGFPLTLIVMVSTVLIVYYKFI
ncbi:sodium:sulfate symporter [Thalassobacillus devorans]|uniref:Sodium:sulfate symporter n=1 Tax=Thalassobacillus devorans TaxID=279813 RepID=A0ABQ1NTB2_9BACI|nr:SLC13 family permease [Thalassobacillus devorans]NIK28625.1 di/tricarboxylate transporter [Thalassobacillus devorans]GGC84777.1 sodium:sulfate symporter [Thalassobacillus devorans]